MAEMIINGTFDSDVSDWSTGSASAEWISEGGGRVKVTNLGTPESVGYIYQTFATVVGETYTVSITNYGANFGNDVNGMVKIGPGSSPNAWQYHNGQIANTTLNTSFEATDTLATVTLRVNNTVAGRFTRWDNVSIDGAVAVTDLDVGATTDTVVVSPNDATYSLLVDIQATLPPISLQSFSPTLTVMSDLEVLPNTSVVTVNALDHKMDTVFNPDATVGNQLTNSSFDTDYNGWTPGTSWSETPIPADEAIITIENNMVKIQNGNNGFGYIYQTFDTVIGEEYTVQYTNVGNQYWANDNAFGQVRIGSGKWGNEIASKTAFGNTDTFKFTATQQTTTITLAPHATDASQLYTYFDNVQVIGKGVPTVIDVDLSVTIPNVQLNSLDTAISAQVLSIDANRVDVQVTTHSKTIVQIGFASLGPNLISEAEFETPGDIGDWIDNDNRGVTNNDGKLRMANGTSSTDSQYVYHPVYLTPGDYLVQADLDHYPETSEFKVGLYPNIASFPLDYKRTSKGTLNGQDLGDLTSYYSWITVYEAGTYYVSLGKVGYGTTKLDNVFVRRLLGNITIPVTNTPTISLAPQDTFISTDGTSLYAFNASAEMDQNFVDTRSECIENPYFHQATPTELGGNGVEESGWGFEGDVNLTSSIQNVNDRNIIMQAQYADITRTDITRAWIWQAIVTQPGQTYTASVTVDQHSEQSCTFYLGNIRSADNVLGKTDVLPGETVNADFVAQGPITFIRVEPRLWGVVGLHTRVSAVSVAPKAPQEPSVSINLRDYIVSVDPVYSIVDITEPSKGTASLSNDILTYTPNRHITGQDTFSYTVENSTGQQAIGEMTVNVNELFSRVTTLSRIEPIEIQEAVVYDIIPEGVNHRNLTYKIVKYPTRGSITHISPLGKIGYRAGGNRYAPSVSNEEFLGTDRFTYVVINGDWISEETVVEFIIKPYNHPPVALVPKRAQTQWAAANVDRKLPIPIILGGYDLDSVGPTDYYSKYYNPQLTYSIVDQPQVGKVVTRGGSYVIFSPDITKTVYKDVEFTNSLQQTDYRYPDEIPDGHFREHEIFFTYNVFDGDKYSETIKVYPYAVSVNPMRSIIEQRLEDAQKPLDYQPYSVGDHAVAMVAVDHQLSELPGYNNDFPLVESRWLDQMMDWMGVVRYDNIATKSQFATPGLVNGNFRGPSNNIQTGNMDGWTPGGDTAVIDVYPDYLEERYEGGIQYLRKGETYVPNYHVPRAGWKPALKILNLSTKPTYVYQRFRTMPGKTYVATSTMRFESFASTIPNVANANKQSGTSIKVGAIPNSAEFGIQRTAGGGTVSKTIEFVATGYHTYLTLHSDPEEIGDSSTFYSAVVLRKDGEEEDRVKVEDAVKPIDVREQVRNGDFLNDRHGWVGFNCDLYSDLYLEVLGTEYRKLTLEPMNQNTYFAMQRIDYLVPGEDYTVSARGKVVSGFDDSQLFVRVSTDGFGGDLVDDTRTTGSMVVPVTMGGTFIAPVDPEDPTKALPVWVCVGGWTYDVPYGEGYGPYDPDNNTQLFEGMIEFETVSMRGRRRLPQATDNGGAGVTDIISDENVATIADRDAINTASLDNGYTVTVEDVGDGTWAQYQWIEINGQGQWHLIVAQQDVPDDTVVVDPVNNLYVDVTIPNIHMQGHAASVLAIVDISIDTTMGAVATNEYRAKVDIVNEVSTNGLNVQVENFNTSVIDGTGNVTFSYVTVNSYDADVFNPIPLLVDANTNSIVVTLIQPESVQAFTQVAATSNSIVVTKFDPAVTASNYVFQFDLKLIPGDSLARTAIEASQITDLYLGGAFANKAKVESFKVGNTGTYTTNVRATIQGVNADLVDSATLSQDKITYSQSVDIYGIEPNQISDPIWTRFVADISDAAGMGTYIINLEEF